MIKVFWISDTHLGLKTDEIDRTEEIYDVTREVILKAIKAKEKGEDAIFVMGGDIFDNNTPSEKHIAVFIKLLGLIKKANLKTFIMVGNHEAIGDPNRLSCLSFIKELKTGYPSIELVEDIKMVKVGVFDSGPAYFTFLPHVSRATIEAKVKNTKAKKDLTTQDYIEKKSMRILEKIGKGSHNLVFSHLNVKGAHGGSEENLLKKSEVYLPKVFLEPPMGYVKPIIIQGHIHSNQMYGDNVYIVGSPIFCSFGEALTPKYYAEIHMKGNISEEDDVILEQTIHNPFAQLELNMIGETREFFEIPEVQKFLNSLNPEQAPYVKFDITIDPDCNNYNWQRIREKIQTENNFHVKNIVPRIVVERRVRSKDQKIDLKPEDAVKIWIKKNLKKKPNKAKQVYALSLKYIGDKNEQSRV
jgi:DNA repair exonuclease SbcCD nuclease subunit